ncbi:TenA family transcriptional regulator [Picrophilus oshimae]|uniref:Pyrroloquinoline quinone (PQQ) biosynthesis protein C n=1 Tax=Picrophilus torridus (strain ATCC 700027 / DSM 9790 / JCM 10055 / NBRC 100828 / KAW 2/3) TaxID=1122961 RepID=Q6KZ95_PICTO|nr:iron-containing redox enzyme family protein [Picrophilus oshimae]AAT43957.1 TenA/THI-4 family protein [Picrophilus oshimae DSM 9789]SMD30970.1 Pyrroloquinoline quinone (PQQ) biosynthesis protein C [Picrophilus oshimae DSM 9789]
MSFYEDIKNLVKNHPATNNDFINRFSQGKITDSEFKRFSIEFYHFTREWPQILSTLLVNTPNEDDARELTTILVSELGGEDPAKRHELLYRRYLRSINMNPEELVKREKLPTTKAWLDGMREFFASDYAVALGSEFGLENMAIPMWDKLIPGLKIMKEKYPNMDITYFTFHREIESAHEDATANIVGIHTDKEKNDFMEGARRILDLEEQFWLGLADKK